MARKPRRTTHAYWLAGAAAAVGFTALGGACGSPTDAPLLTGQGPTSYLDGAVQCAPGHAGCPCTTPGQAVACGKFVQEYENYTSCAEGQSTCTNGVWGPCATGTTVLAKSTRALTIGTERDPVTGIPRLAQTNTPCSSDAGLTPMNVCDPNMDCNLTIDTPSDIDDAAGLAFTDAGVTIPASGGGAEGGTACTQLQCAVTYCPGNPNGTTVTGKVFDPAGNNPLYNAWVYVPLDPTAALPPFAAGEQCSTCAGAASLNAVAVAETAPDGTFTLTNVPTGSSIPIVVQMGKWRRETTISVTACTNNAIDDGTLRLPQSQTDGLNGHADLPQIAFVSGSADPFECMLLKAGISPGEFGSSTLNSNRRIHYYNSPDSPGDSIDPSYGNVVPGSQLWNGAPDGGTNGGWSLSNYDVVILACEGAEYNVADRNVTGYSNLVQYAAGGGRIFLSHFSYVWMKYNTPWQLIPNSWSSVGTIDTQDPLYASIVTSGFPKGLAFQTWLGDIGALVGPDGGTLTGADGGAPNPDAGGVLTLHQARQDTTSPLASSAQSWMTATDTVSNALNPATYSPSFTFNTPVTAAQANQCGRVVFSDFHVATSAQVSSTNGAVACQADFQCGYGATCTSPVLGTCTQPACFSASTCGDTHFTCPTGAYGTCERAACSSTAQCASGECVTVGGSQVCGCTKNSDCGANGSCSHSHVCTLPPSCQTSSDCQGSGETSDATCNGAVSGTCTPNSCTTDAKCSTIPISRRVSGQEHCVGGTCSGCYTNNDCPGGGTCVGGIPGGTCTGTGTNFPFECAQGTLDPQEAALEFEFFDLSACVSPNGIVPQGPPTPTIVYNPVSFTVDFTSSCPSGTHVAWRALTWQASIPPTASIVFSAQTTNPPSDGGPPNYSGVQSVTIATATNATQSSSAGIDLTSSDGGPAGAFESATPPVSSQDDLRLTITLNPTSGQIAPPTLTDWQVTSDCPSSE